MVLFLVGISVAVNNSTHENQTAGNSCCIPLYSKQVYEVKVWNFWQIQKIKIALNHTRSYCTVCYDQLLIKAEVRKALDSCANAVIYSV